MQAKDLALALSIITKAYPEAEMIPQENSHLVHDRYIVVQIPDTRPMVMHPQLEAILKHLGFHYSDSHGACWYAAI